MNYKSIAQKELPFQGKFFLSKDKKYNELIFFVHFFEGSPRALLRHVKFVNDLGFDAFTFQLAGDSLSIFKKLPIFSDLKFGLKHLYASQITRLLNEIPGDKIIYSFSNPCASAIEAMALRHCQDTPAMICDSGPTAHFIPSARKLIDQYDISYFKKILLKPLTPILSYGWSPQLHHDLYADLEKFPKDFPLLSIRGWKDQLIPPAHIDDVFAPHKHLNWSKVNLPEAQHLTGLRDCKEDYTPPVSEFLKKVATSYLKDS